MCYSLNRQLRKKPNLDLDIQFSGTDCQVKYSFHSLLLSIVSFFYFSGTDCQVKNTFHPLSLLIVSSMFNKFNLSYALSTQASLQNKISTAWKNLCEESDINHQFFFFTGNVILAVHAGKQWYCCNST